MKLKAVRYILEHKMRCDMSAYYCDGCDRLRRVRYQGYVDVGNDRGVCEDCGCNMQEKAVDELMEHWNITAPASEVNNANQGALTHVLYTMPLADLLVRLRDMKGER